MPKPKPRCANCSSITVDSHLEWAAAIGSRVARHHHLHGQERDDLISIAQLALLEHGPRYSPERTRLELGREPTPDECAGAFRGYVYRHIMCVCNRAVDEMRGGGTFRTVRPENKFTCPVLGDAAGDLGDDTEEFTIREDGIPEPEVITPPTARPVYGRRLAGGRV